MKRIIKKIRQKKNKSSKVGARHEGVTCSREDKIRVGAACPPQYPTKITQ